MLFNSFEFLIFFPIVTAVYFALSARLQWIWLLVMSYFFYMNWHAEYALLMAACTLVTFIASRLIVGTENKKKRKLVFTNEALSGLLSGDKMLAQKITKEYLDNYWANKTALPESDSPQQIRLF